VPKHDVQSEPPCVLLTPELTIVEASEDYRVATLLWREDVRGLSIFDVFPDNPYDPTADGAVNLRHSLHHVLSHQVIHQMHVQRYDVRDRLSETCDWVEKHWLPTNSPVFGSGSNEIVYLTHQVTDVTQAVLRRRWLDEELTVLREQYDTIQRMLGDITERQQVLDAQRAQLDAILLDPARAPSYLSQLLSNLQVPGHSRRLHPGEHAPISGIYDMLHFEACQLAPTRIFVREGRHLPQCPNCRHRVLFRLFKRCE
jgi:hypothetical protein